MSRKCRKCPKCDSNSVAKIIYGLVAYDEQMERDLDAGKIVLGGCCISNDSPEWHCNECWHKWSSMGRKSG